MANAVEPVKEQERQFFQMVADNIGVKYGIDLMVDRVRQMIHVKFPDRQTVTNADVAAVLTEAMAKHLDPLKGGLYAFKDKDNRLVIGTTKRGFQQSLSSQVTFRDCIFKPQGEVKTKVVDTGKGRKTISYVDAVTCIIRKHFPDGTTGTIEGTAYFDEEFNPMNAAWVKSPRRLLDGRALCIASANAYGWGAYDAEEAGRAMGFNVETDADSGDVIEVDNLAEAEVVNTPAKSGASRAKAAIAKAADNTDAKQALMKLMQECESAEQLRLVFATQATPELKKDPDVINLGKAMAQHFELEK